MTIDWWTLGIQTVNVAVLVWLLQRFFWRPVAAMIARRRDATRRTLAEAQATQNEAAAAMAQIELTRAGFATERDAILAAARQDAGHTAAALLADARRQAATLEAAARSAIETEQRAAEAAWRERSVRLAISIAGQLAARLDGAAVRDAFLEWLAREIAALPDVARKAAARGATLNVISAAPLDPAERDRARDRIIRALGGAASIAFDTDPALIAGLELHGPHLLVSNSWRADLANVLAALSGRGEAVPPPRSADDLARANETRAH